MFRHRVVAVLTAAALLAGVPVAFAQSSGAKKPLGKMTCEEFLVLEGTFKPKVVYWAVAYGKGGKPEAAVLQETREEDVTGRVTAVESSGPPHNRNLNALLWRMP